MEYRVGCSGWSYPHWRHVFYPDGLPQSRWFQHYASVFDTVELNGTFYGLPSERTVDSWHKQAPPGFRFSAKASRLITHFRRLKGTDDALERYLTRMRRLGDRLGPILYQLAPNLEKDIPLLRDFLDLLPGDLTHVFEFRNEGWWTKDVFRLLHDHDAAFCVYDMGKTETPVIATSSDFYVRFHGPSSGYAGGYSQAALSKWAARIKDLRGVQTAWVYFNNDTAGHAPKDAQRLHDLLPS
jgi:uncharacterized protein YecE (DUF72 family)